jgi:hypothetical protein
MVYQDDPVHGANPYAQLTCYKCMYQILKTQRDTAHLSRKSNVRISEMVTVAVQEHDNHLNGLLAQIGGW